MPTGFQELSAGRGFVGRLPTGSDLIAEIERFCAEHNVLAAQVTAIGAVRHAAFAYYDEETKGYVDLESSTHREIVGFTGHISERDGRPFLHAHATFGDASGATVGGHLRAGNEVFMVEIMIREITGVSLVRTFDEATGLHLW
jgi:predicted DNA-binding protein with PD1-like motif